MKDIQKQLNTLKAIKPEKNWVASARQEILGKKESFFSTSLSPNFSFGSLALVATFLFMVTVFTSFNIPEVQMTENKVTPGIMRIVENMRNREAEVEIMMATEFPRESAIMNFAEIDFENLSDVEQRQLIRESADYLLAEIDQLEERILRVMAVQK